MQRFRSKAAAPANAPAADRLLPKGSPVPPALWGRNKGTECILRERGLSFTNLKGACANEKAHTDDGKCCCQRMFASQQDFKAERSALQHAVETRIIVDGGMSSLRHLCLFLPKFHCELNWIERMWGVSKAYARSHCMYTLQGLRDTVPISLSQDISELPDRLRLNPDLPVCPLHLQRRWARISRQYMREYRKGADACEAIRAVTEQRTKAHAPHRDTSDSRCRQQEAQMAASSVGM